jgi:putative ABC transport system permease protein
MLRNYLKIAFKVLLRRKFFTAISLFGTSFTLVVLMVATAVFDHAVARMPPETRQDRTLGVYFARMIGEHNRWYSEPGYLFLDRYTRDLPGVERMSIFSKPALVNSYLNGVRIASSLKRTDGEFWKILDFPFLEGGPFTSDDVANARFVAVVSATTRRRFFGDGPAIGKTLEADGQRFRIVGVVEDVPELRTVPFAEIWVPLTTAKSDAYRHELLGDFCGIYLARSRDDFPAIREEFRSRMKKVELPRGFKTIYALPETPMEHVASAILGGTPFRQLVVEDTGDISLARFWGAAAVLGLLFMLLPTLNLVNLQVSRILERASEIGVRKAFGASSRTLVGQFVVENVALTVVGGVLGFLVSRLVLDALTASGFLAYARFTMNPRIFLYGFGLAVFFGVLSGAYPAWRMSRLHPVLALRGSAR